MEKRLCKTRISKKKKVLRIILGHAEGVSKRRRSKKRKSVRLVDEETEEVSNSVAVAEYNAICPDRPRNILGMPMLQHRDGGRFRRTI